MSKRFEKAVEAHVKASQEHGVRSPEADKTFAEYKAALNECRDEDARRWGEN